MTVAMSDNYYDKKLEMINGISPSFCLAKWLQVTIDLVNGTTHSCHHPKRHAIPLNELKNDVSALHNTQYKKEQRKKMLEGERPSECSYCWDIEDLGNKYSDRFVKSIDPWAWPHLEEIKTLPWDANVSPKYLEVMVDSLCNFSCAYCISDVSTGVAAEIKKFGNYPFNSQHRLPSPGLPLKSNLPYLEAFEQWLPQIMNQLKVFRITGGEPLLSAQFWKILQNLQHANNPALDLIVNSHLSHNTSVIQKMCDGVNPLLSNKKIKSFALYVSLDTFGEQAEYIRHGLDYKRVLKNIEHVFAQIPGLEMVIMCTFNILSIDSFSAFLEDLISLKKKYPILLDISYLKNPGYLRADLADENLVFKIKESLDKMILHPEFFTLHEVSKMRNLLDWVKSEKSSEAMQLNLQDRSFFFLFINEYDRRKQKNFLNIFPNYATFLSNCEKTYHFTKDTTVYAAKNTP